MRSLTYVSTTDPDFGLGLMHQVAPARRRNELLGVTGRLLFSGGNVLHTIEGPERWVGMLFELFASDPRNWSVWVLLDEPVEDRTFADWSIGFRHPPAPGATPDGWATYAPRPGVPSHDAPPSPVLRLHEMFRENMR